MPAASSFKEKPVEWMGSSRKDLRACGEEVKDVLGYALHVAQWGGMHPNAKRMKGALRDVIEIVADEDRATYRGMYTVTLEGVVYVLHVFKKKSTQGIKTPQRDLEIIAKRLEIAREHHRRHYASMHAHP